MADWRDWVVRVIDAMWDSPEDAMRAERGEPALISGPGPLLRILDASPEVGGLFVYRDRGDWVLAAPAEELVRAPDWSRFLRLCERYAS